jgi:formylmethanofuran dehydrogenase subunit C
MSCCHEPDTMSATIFKLRGEPDQRLDLSGLSGRGLARLGESEVAALVVSTGKARLTVGDVFRVTMGDTADIRIAGGSGRFDNVGNGLTGGRITVEGDVGVSAGRAMSGGELRITGSAGPHAGCAMSGGLIHIGVDAGDHLGGAPLGELMGMRGGTIVVAGRAGARAGDRMRRGMIAIGGDAGDFPASRMIAGTVAVLGNCGRLPAYLMRRGTLLLGGEAASWTPTFGESGMLELTMLRLVTRELKTLLPAGRFAGFEGPVRRFAGDMATLGKGEIIRPAGA